MAHSKEGKLPNHLSSLIYRGFSFERLPHSIKELLRLIKKKDIQTYQHSIRVGLIAKQIGKLVNLSSNDLEKLFYAGLLHDVGKITIPVEILKKSSSLNKHEQEVMSFHPLGTKAFLNFEGLSQYAKYAYLHHERYDGKGYPIGLKGEEIPYQSRIILLADTFDAMNSNRSYRKALPLKIIIDELNNHKGAQFDPYFTEKFIEFLLGYSTYKKVSESSYSHYEPEQSCNHLR